MFETCRLKNVVIFIQRNLDSKLKNCFMRSTLHFTLLDILLSFYVCCTERPITPTFIRETFTSQDQNFKTI